MTASELSPAAGEGRAPRELVMSRFLLSEGAPQWEVVTDPRTEATCRRNPGVWEVRRFVEADPAPAVPDGGQTTDARADARTVAEAAVDALDGTGEAPRLLERMLKRESVKVVSPETGQDFEVQAAYAEADIDQPDRNVTIVHLVPSAPAAPVEGDGRDAIDWLLQPEAAQLVHAAMLEAERLPERPARIPHALRALHARLVAPVETGDGADARDGVALIAAERRRQVEQEGWTPEHDDRHDGGELHWAAAQYLGGLRMDERGEVTAAWPWLDSPAEAPRHHGELRDYVRAGALIAAEIDRLQRRPSPGVREEDRNGPTVPPVTHTGDERDGDEEA